jgi:hypothetical protein
MENPVRNHPRLPRPGAGNDEKRSFGMKYRLFLPLAEFFKVVHAGNYIIKAISNTEFLSLREISRRERISKNS